LWARSTKEHLEKRSGEKNVDSRFQAQLEEDGGGSTGLEVCGHISLGVTRHK